MDYQEFKAGGLAFFTLQTISVFKVEISVARWAIEERFCRRRLVIVFSVIPQWQDAYSAVAAELQCSYIY